MKCGITILTWDKVDFKAKIIIKVKEGNFIVIKGQFIKRTTILSIYAHSNRASKYVQQKLTEL